MAAVVGARAKRPREEDCASPRKISRGTGGSVSPQLPTVPEIEEPMPTKLAVAANNPPDADAFFTELAPLSGHVPSQSGLPAPSAPTPEGVLAASGLPASWHERLETEEWDTYTIKLLYQEERTRGSGDPPTRAETWYLVLDKLRTEAPGLKLTPDEERQLIECIEPDIVREDQQELEQLVEGTSLSKRPEDLAPLAGEGVNPDALMRLYVNQEAIARASTGPPPEWGFLAEIRGLVMTWLRAKFPDERRSLNYGFRINLLLPLQERIRRRRVNAAEWAARKIARLEALGTTPTEEQEASLAREKQNLERLREMIAWVSN